MRNILMLNRNSDLRDSSNILAGEISLFLISKKRGELHPAFAMYRSTNLFFPRGITQRVVGHIDIFDW